MSSRRLLHSASRRFSSSTAVNTKVSSSSSPDALFAECLSKIRVTRASVEAAATRQMLSKGRDTIASLSADETQLMRRVFERTQLALEDGTGKESDPAKGSSDGIDPYWDPFQELHTEQDKLDAAFSDYSKVASAAEARARRLEIRRAVRRAVTKYDPLSGKKSGDVDYDTLACLAGLLVILAAHYLRTWCIKYLLNSSL